MKYVVWWVRLVFGAWMIPAGLNHFVPLFPQPLGSQPLSYELMVALLDSHLMAVIKAVELVAGLCVFTGWYAALGLVVCMPVSFCVYYWDAHLQRSGAAVYGVATLLGNVLLCLAYVRSYRTMFALRATPAAPPPRATQFSPVGRPVYESLFVHFRGRTSRADFIPAFVTLLAAALFYGVTVEERPGMRWMVVMMIFPAFALHATRVRGMGRSAWLLLAPAALAIVALAIWLRFISFGSAPDSVLVWLGLAAYAALLVWNVAGSDVAQPTLTSRPAQLR